MLVFEEHYIFLHERFMVSMADLLFLFFLSSLLLPKSAVGYDLRDSEVFTCLLRYKYNQIPEKTCEQTDIHFEPYQGGMLMFWGFMPLW